MKFSLLSYNLDFGQGILKLPELIKQNEPDIITLQEVNTLDVDELSELMDEYDLKLAHYAHSTFRRNTVLGVATFYNPKRIALDNNHVIFLPRGVYEFMDFLFRRPIERRTVLKTTFVYKKKKFCIYNLHLSPFARNTLRIKQIDKIFKSLDKDNKPTIVVGDFNYPIRRKNFEKLFKEHGFREGTEHIFDTFKSFIKIFPFRLKLDYVLYKYIDTLETKKIPVRYSDHYPLITTFEL